MSSFSGGNRKHIPQVRSNDKKKGFIAYGTVSFGNVEPSMISLSTEVMMRTILSVMQNNIREKVSW